MLEIKIKLTSLFLDFCQFTLKYSNFYLVIFLPLIILASRMCGKMIRKYCWDAISCFPQNQSLSMRMNSVTFSSTNIHAFPTFTWLRTWNHDKTVYLSLGKMSLETTTSRIASSPFARCLWLYLAQKQRGSKTWKWKLDRVTTEKRRDVVQKAPVNMSTDKRFNEWMYHTCLFKWDLRDIMFNFSLLFFCSCFYMS